MKKTLFALASLAFATAAHAGPYDQGYDDGAYDSAAHQQTMAWIDQQGRQQEAELRKFEEQRNRQASDDYSPMKVKGDDE